MAGCYCDTAKQQCLENPAFSDYTLLNRREFYANRFGGDRDYAVCIPGPFNWTGNVDPVTNVSEPDAAKYVEQP